MTSTAAARQHAHFVGIFIIALAVLAYQVLLTRLFSVMLYYHFAFAGISLVMLGLTIGAQHVYLHAERFSVGRLEEEWAKAALRFSLSSVLLVMWFMYSPLLFSPNIAFMVVISSLILFAVPFVYSGICVTLTLTRSPFSIGRLYAADLVGAAMGCFGIVAILFLLDPISIFFGLAALIAFSAYVMAPPGTATALQAKILVVVWCVACLLQSSFYLGDHDHLRLMWAKGHRQENIIFERWNAFSRIRVVPYSDMPQGVRTGPFGWGFGHPQIHPIQQYFLDIDADAGTVITRFDGKNLTPFAFLGNDVINMGYHIRPVKTVAVIGVGGGRDIMSALYFGVQHVTGIEINPAIFEALTKKFADFTGNFYKRPDVTLVNAEARSWLNQSQQSFGLIQISLIDTWAATAAGGLTMSENKLYTVDAWKDFLNRLTPDGMLTVSRWFDPMSHKAEFYRLLSLASETLKQCGVAPGEVRAHILAFESNGIVTIAVSPGVFTPAEVANARRSAAQEGFKVMIDPGTAWDDISGTIASGKATDAFYNAMSADVTAPTDNRPFFFYTWRPLNVLFWKKETDKQGGNNLAVLIMGTLLLSTFLCTIIFIIEPLLKRAHEAPVKKMLPYLGYFGGIGLGFMLIEISQMQRLMIFLGHPVFGLTVVLFTLLLFGGLGSFTVHSETRSERLWVRPVLLCAVLCIVGLLTPHVTYGLKASGVPVRVLVSVALLAPAGFCMGMMFPTGMIMSKPFQQQQAWFWGINGATSVFASVLGMAISMEYGIAQAYWAGVVCYLACLLLVLRYAKR